MPTWKGIQNPFRANVPTGIRTSRDDGVDSPSLVPDGVVRGVAAAVGFMFCLRPTCCPFHVGGRDMPIWRVRGFGMKRSRGPSTWGAKRTVSRPVEVRRRNWRRALVISLGSYVALWIGLILWVILGPTPNWSVGSLFALGILVAIWLLTTLFIAWWWGPFDALPRGWGNRAKIR